MLSPHDNGSKNEETSFIRRVAPPDRPNANRRQTKRLAMAGAALSFIGASAGIGYATLRSQQWSGASTSTQELATSLAVPDFVESMGDPYYPSFEQLDEDGDGVVSYAEYMKDLNEVWAQDKENIENSDLPEVVKEDLNDQLDDKIKSDTACVKKAMVPTKKRTLTFDKKTIDSLYYMLEVYCFETPIEIPDKYMKMFPDTEAPTPQPVIPDIPPPPAKNETENTVIIDTPKGPVTVSVDGPVIDDKQLVTITTADGSSSTTTVDVTKTSDGQTALEIPTGSRGSTTTVTVPSTSSGGSGANGYQNQQQQQQQMQVQTPNGPVTVSVDGPVIDDKQLVTITTADGSSSTTTVDVTKTSDGQTALEIPTGSRGSTTTVTVPSTSSGGSGANGYQNPNQNQNQNVDTSGLPSVQFPAYDGVLKIVFNGPALDGKASVTLIRGSGTVETLTLDATLTPEGHYTVNIPTGPADQTWTVAVPPKQAFPGYGSEQQQQPSSGGGSAANGFQIQNQNVTELPSLQLPTYDGIVKVVFNGPVIDNKVTVTLSKASGTRTVTLDASLTPDGYIVDIPTGPGDQTWTVRVPPKQAFPGYAPEAQPSTQQQQQQQQMQVQTPNGPVTVSVDGPVIDDKQLVTITTADGSSSTTTVDVTKTSDGQTALEIPTGSRGSTTTVTVPSTSSGGSGANGYQNQQQQQQQMQVQTPNGPVTVSVDGPVIDDKQLVTITTADGSSSTTTVDVTKTSDGQTALEIPTGSRGSTTTVTVPSTSSGGSGANGYQNPNQNQNQNVDTSGLPSVQFPAYDGVLKIVFNGPALDGKASVTLIRGSGTVETLTLDATLTPEGHYTVNIPTGPADQTWTVAVPPKQAFPGYGSEQQQQPSSGGGSAANGFQIQNQNVTELPSLQLPTYDGIVKVVFNGPVIDNKVTVTLSKASGTRTVTLDASLTPDGYIVDIPTGPGDQTWTVRVPPKQAFPGYAPEAQPSTQQQQQQQQVQVQTPNGPVTVSVDGPVIDDKQLVTITTADGSSSTTTVDVTKTSDGQTALEIPTGSRGSTTTVTVPSTSSGGSGANGYQNQQQQQQQMQVQTPNGPVTVSVDGPVIDDKQLVTITTADGSSSTTTVDVTKTSDGQTALEIPTGSRGSTTTVTVPSTSSGGSGANGYQNPNQNQNQNVDTSGLPSVQFPAYDGVLKIVFNGPALDGKASVTLIRGSGTVETLTLDATLTPEGHYTVNIPTGPADQTWTVAVPPKQAFPGYGSEQQQQPSSGGGSAANGFQIQNQNVTELPSLQLPTYDGIVKVVFNGPVIDNKVTVTLSKASGTRTVTLDASLTPDGYIVDIPTGPGDQTWTVRVPPKQAFPGYAPEAQPSTQQQQQQQQVQVQTPNGPVTVSVDGPVIDDKQLVTITTADGSSSTTTVDVTKTSDGQTALEIPTGSRGSTTTVTVPSTSTGGSGGHTTSNILNQLGGNAIDNGDKDFMSRDEFQLQIGTHFSEKIMALKEQAHQEEAESEKTLDQQKRLQDCILQASERFGYYGVYEQPPHFTNAVDWINNDCMKQ